MSDFRTIPLSRGLEAIVDAADHEAVSAFKWYAMSPGSGAFYAARSVAARHGWTISLHRQLMCAPAGLQVDHINGDTLDNRRANLRVCTIAENHWNSRRRADNSSGYIGVSFKPSLNKWMAMIKSGGAAHYLGVFPDKLDAARAYDAAALAQRGAFARLNFPEAD